MKTGKYSFPLLLIVLLSAMMAGCKKENRSVQSEYIPDFQLPQGNNPYDQRIMDFYKETGIAILYKYTQKDFRWNLSNFIGAVGFEGDPAWVNASLDTLHKHFFGQYDKAFLRRLLPQKVYLASKIQKLKAGSYLPEVSATDSLQVFLDATSTFNNIGFGYAGPALEGLTASGMSRVRAEMHKLAWMEAVLANKVEVPKDFYAGIDYDKITASNYKAAGILEFVFAEKTGKSLVTDVASYIKFITGKTITELNNTVFSAASDPTGIYRKRYKILTDFYKSKYNLDLQAIGNFPY